METKILKVVEQTEPVYVPSKKTESGQLAKSTIKLRELGGDYENQYVGTLFGTLALSKFAAGEMVIASLRFLTHESNGAHYQDVVINDLKVI